MARQTGFQVQGLSQVVRALQELGAEVEDLKDAFSAIAREGAEKASGFAPRVSGRLSGNVRGNRAKSKAVVAAGGASVPYAGAVNYGWPARHITGAGFMQAADEAMRPVAIQKLEDEINRQIRLKGLN